MVTRGIVISFESPARAACHSSVSSPAARAASARRWRRALLARGHRVAITGTTPSGVARAERALAEQCGDPGRVLGLACDVREPAAVERAVRTVVARFGGLDVLVNNAGVGVGQPMSDMPYDEWNRIIGTNLTGVYHCCRAAIPHLVARGGGWIVNISSLASKNPFAGGAAYCASKAGLNAFSEALMQELRHSNIRVSYVLPGSVATGFSGRAADSRRGLEAEPGRCGAGDRRPAGSPGAEPAEPRGDSALAAAEVEGFGPQALKTSGPQDFRTPGPPRDVSTSTFAPVTSATAGHGRARGRAAAATAHRGRALDNQVFLRRHRAHRRPQLGLGDDDDLVHDLPHQAET